MEKFVDTEYLQFKNDPSTTPEASACKNCSFSIGTKNKNEYKSCKVSKVLKKIASDKWTGNQSSPMKSITLEKMKHISGSKLNVLKRNMADTARQSVLRKTKINNRNVPDRLGKYVSNYDVRSETKLLFNDCKMKNKLLTNECSNKGSVESLREYSKTNNQPDFNESSLPLLGTECLSNNDSVSLRNSFESGVDSKNIFENFFNDCLDSTSKEKDVSSQENIGIDVFSESVTLGFNNSKKSYDNIFEKAMVKTPVKKRQELLSPPTPVKVKDHNNYFSTHKNVRHVCAYCQKIFKSNGKLNSHVYSHTGERPFDCSHCGKAFSSKFKLVRHLLIHSEIRKFVCQICDRTFLRNDHLKNHYKVHDPKKKTYKCSKENCDKEYSSLMSHKKHMAYHSVEDGDLKCLICNVKYETKEEILFHLKSHSGSRLFKSQSDKKFKCEFCDRLFLTRKDVTRHLVVHTGERDFLCQFCPQRFGRKDHLVRHIKKSHGNEDISVKSETDGKLFKEEAKKLDIKSKRPDKKYRNSIMKNDLFSATTTSNSNIPNGTFGEATTKENNTQTEECLNKTHIVITVQGKSAKSSMKNRRKKFQGNVSKNKPFQKSDSLVPRKKQVPLAKNKHSTTQILLQNVPNILIIPNNSIILLRNQSDNKTSTNEGNQSVPVVDSEPTLPIFQNVGTPLKENLTSLSEELCNSTENENFDLGYEPNSYQAPSQFSGGFPDGDIFGNFQSELPPLGSNLVDSEPDHLTLEMINQNDLHSLLDNDSPQRNEETSSLITLLAETPHITKLSTEKLERESIDCIEHMPKGLFSDGNHTSTMSEAVLNDFRDESSLIFSAENSLGILNNILNQTNDNCGFELLRNLFTADNPALSPLPGFNQIFHNANTNPN